MMRRLIRLLITLDAFTAIDGYEQPSDGTEGSTSWVKVHAQHR